jgi:hypothetical protein
MDAIIFVGITIFIVFVSFTACSVKFCLDAVDRDAEEPDTFIEI